MKNFKKLVLTGGCGAAIALTTLTGCQTWGNHSSDRTAGRVTDDKATTARVQRALQNEPVYKFSDVDVKTFNGAVQLSGFVTTEDQKRQAGTIAQQVEGVGQVINNITLKPGVPTPTGRANEFGRPRIEGTYSK
jgi:hyperosmotically inducible protein